MSGHGRVRGQNSLKGRPGDPSFVRASNHTVKAEVVVKVAEADELSPAQEDVGEALAKRAAHRAKGNKWPAKGQPKGRRLKLAVLGLDRDILDRGDPRYKSALRTASTYRKHRARELCVAHGYVSAGASALLATAALALAASRYLYEQVALSGDLGYLKQAAQLADSARQNELAAWELAAREGTARKKAAAADAGVPWLATVDGGHKKSGRKRNVDKVKEVIDTPALPEVGGDLLSWVGQSAEQQKDVKNGLESNRRSKVSVVPGVPGDGGQPDVGSDPLHGAAGGNPGTEADPSGEGHADSKAVRASDANGDDSSTDD